MNNDSTQPPVPAPVAPPEAAAVDPAAPVQAFGDATVNNSAPVEQPTPTEAAPAVDPVAVAMSSEPAADAPAPEAPAQADPSEPVSGDAAVDAAAPVEPITPEVPGVSAPEELQAPSEPPVVPPAQ